MRNAVCITEYTAAVPARRLKMRASLLLKVIRKKATVEVKAAIRKLDVAASKGIIHKNNAARRKSRLMKQLHNMS